MIDKYLCPHAQSDHGHSSCIYSGFHPSITKTGDKYTCNGQGEFSKFIENCAYLYELSLLEKIAEKVDFLGGGLDD